MISQKQLEDFLKAKQEAEESEERYQTLRRQLSKEGKTGPVEPGRYGLKLTTCERRFITLGKIRDAFGENVANRVRDGIPPSTYTRVEVTTS